MSAKKRQTRSDKGVKRVEGGVAGPTSAQTGRSVHRIPFGGYRDRLRIENKDPNYHYHWHADRFSEIDDALRAGYRFITSRDARVELPEVHQIAERRDRGDDRMTVHGGVGDFGIGFKLIAMRLPNELWEQDRKERAKKPDAIDQSIYRPELDGGKVVDNEYADTSGIHTETGKVS